MADSAAKTEIELTVDGYVFGGWKEARVTRSLETIAGTFDLTLSERYPGQQAVKGILPGQQCTVTIDGEIAITGYIDDVAPDYDATKHEVKITGRDVTGDLVDCSAVHKPGEWHSLKLEMIARILCEPFGIKVTAATDTGDAFKKFKLEESESVFEAIDRACRMRAILPTSDGHGGLILTRAGDSRASISLKRGENILKASGQLSWKDRYSHYTVKSQQPKDDDDGDLPPEFSTQVRGDADDRAVGRYRPLVIIAEKASTQQDAVGRATWEANVRAARARRITITVQGWRETPKGALWIPNRLITVTDDWLSIDQEMLIASTSVTKGSQGSTTDLALLPKEAFQLIRLPEPKEDDGWMA